MPTCYHGGRVSTLLARTPARDLEAAQLNVEQAQLELAGAQRALAETMLLAPSAGTVLAVDAQLG